MGFMIQFVGLVVEVVLIVVLRISSSVLGMRVTLFMARALLYAAPKPAPE